MDLYHDTMRLLRESKTTQAVIARNAGVSPRWIQKLLRNETADPGVHMMTRLYRYLRSEPRRRKRG